jgi:general secretion pathway protein F
LIYPSIVTAFAFLVAVVMLGFVVPSMARMLQDARIALPALTRFMVALGHGVLWAAGPAIAAGVGAVFYLRNRMSRDEPFRRGMDRGLFRLPVIGEGYSLLVNLRFARTLAILVEGGVPIVEGLSLAGKATGSPWVAHLVDAEAESVRHGSSVADAVRRAGPLSEALPGWIHIGEASGSLQRLLEGAAARYQMQWSRLVARCLSVLEPALILFVGSIVLLVALSILLPVMSLNRAVG